MGARPITIETSIHELSPGGDGVAIHEIDGERRAVFVPGAAPNERVRVEVDPSRRPARGRLLAVLEPSASRVPPPCKHVERCGGCDWMFLAPSAQAREHAAIVGRLLGVERDVTSHPAVRELGYRTRARVHVEAKRGRVIVGMFGRRSHEPASVDTCVVLDPILDRARALLPSWLEGAHGRGEAQLSLGRPPTDATTARRPVLDLSFKGELPPAVYGRLERAIGSGDLAGARLASRSGDASPRAPLPRGAGSSRHVGTGVPATIGDPTPFIVGADDQPLQLAPGGFSQATEDGNRRLALRVAEVVAALPPGPCLELYSGAGNFTVLLARDRDVVAVEESAAACVAARANLAARGLARNASHHHESRVVEADASTFAIPKGTKVVVLDPPREGARAICDALADRSRARRSNAPAVVYVACDPPTLARDVKILTAAGWEIRVVETFEMFPHTSHVETLVVLVPSGRADTTRTVDRGRDE
jgi:23S rRNA (uracil1939-C5)-methyltransferase